MYINQDYYKYITQADKIWRKQVGNKASTHYIRFYPEGSGYIEFVNLEPNPERKEYLILDLGYAYESYKTVTRTHTQIDSVKFQSYQDIFDIFSFCLEDTGKDVFFYDLNISYVDGYLVFRWGDKVAYKVRVKANLVDEIDHKYLYVVPLEETRLRVHPLHTLLWDMVKPNGQNLYYMYLPKRDLHFSSNRYVVFGEYYNEYKGTSVENHVIESMLDFDWVDMNPNNYQVDTVIKRSKPYSFVTLFPDMGQVHRLGLQSENGQWVDCEQPPIAKFSIKDFLLIKKFVKTSQLHLVEASYYTDLEAKNPITYLRLAYKNMFIIMRSA